MPGAEQMMYTGRSRSNREWAGGLARIRNRDIRVGRFAGLQRRRRLIVDVLPALDARADQVRQYLRKALHLLGGIRGVSEPGAADYGLEAGHDRRPKVDSLLA